MVYSIEVRSFNGNQIFYAMQQYMYIEIKKLISIGAIYQGALKQPPHLWFVSLDPLHNHLQFLQHTAANGPSFLFITTILSSKFTFLYYIATITPT